MAGCSGSSHPHTSPSSLCTLQKPDTVTEHAAPPPFLKSKNSRAGDIAQWLETLPHASPGLHKPHVVVTHLLILLPGRQKPGGSEVQGYFELYSKSEANLGCMTLSKIKISAWAF